MVVHANQRIRAPINASSAPGLAGLRSLAYSVGGTNM
jgi:hypothetical protein